jgi:hypothetical protein
MTVLILQRAPVVGNEVAVDVAEWWVEMEGARENETGEQLF